MLLKISFEDVQDLVNKYMVKVRAKEIQSGTFGKFVCTEFPAVNHTYDSYLHSQQPDSSVYVYLLRSKSFVGLDLTRGLPDSRRVLVESTAVELHALSSKSRTARPV